ncbi:MAG: peptidase S1 [Caulobacterales bacterium]|jgi:hypothetical protein|nr:peptidase S1 [Caulobacterales bacterium]
MSPIARIFAAGAALTMIAAGSAVAQDYGLNPIYGTVNITAGFTPDPYTVNLQSGGQRDASAISPSCRGYIANAPDFRVNYSAGSFPLIISVASSADTTLVVNGPDGSWYCDDDSGNEGMNPSLRFGSPQSGQYDIWVGTYGQSANYEAQLNISELYTR